MKRSNNDKNINAPYASQMLGLKRGLTYLLMIGEQLSDAFWRSFFWTLLFCGIWLLELPQLFALEGYYAASIIFGSGIIYFLFCDVHKLSWPRRSDINKRIERDSRLKHRPLSELNDKPIVVKSPDTMRLWELEQNRRKKALKKLRVAKWSRFLSSQDTRGLRLMAILVFTTGLLVAGTDWNNRLIQGFIPLDWQGNYSEVPPVIVTITPPEYTKLAQSVLQGAGQLEESIIIPTGSRIKVLMQDSITHPYIVDHGTKSSLREIEDGGYELEWQINAPETLKENEKRRLDVKQFFVSRFGFNYELLPDLAPTIALQAKKPEEKQAAETKKEPTYNNNVELDTSEEELEDTADIDTPEEPLLKAPIILPDSQVQIPLTLFDDYGVRTITISMNLDPLVEEAPLGYAVEQTRSVMSPSGQEFALAPTLDFTDNPWAGLPVTINIIATDHIGQTGALETIEMQLPERVFEHPIAKKLISLRKKLAWEPVNAAIEVHDEIVQILEYPEDFQDDKMVYLALTTAASRLKYSVIQKQDGIEDSKSVMDILWSVALQIEDGNLSIAARNLRHAQMALENALQNDDISQEQISELMNELRLAMQEYLMEFQKELQKRFAQGEELLLTPEMLEELLDPESLADFLSQMENQMLSGDMDNAQGMLSQLQRMLDMLNPNMALPMPDSMLAMMDGVSELQQLIEKQEELLAHTEEQKNLNDRFVNNKDFGELLPPNIDLFMQWGLDDLPPPPSPDNLKQTVPGVDFEARKAEQESLRFILGQLMIETSERVGKIPEKMGLAEREMLYSSDDLENSKPDLSIPHQELAIQYLKEAQEEMQEQLQQQMEQMAGAMNQNGDPFGQRFGQQFGQRGQGGTQYDPLGRPIPGGGGDGEQSLLPDSNVKIPDEAERKRVEEILRTLRERSGELFRPREELEYFRRLLRQF